MQHCYKCGPQHRLVRDAQKKMKNLYLMTKSALFASGQTGLVAHEHKMALQPTFRLNESDP